MTESFSKIAPYLSDPFVLVGFFIFVVFLIARILLQSKIIPQVTKTTGGQIIKLILHYGFLIGLLLIFFAFFYKYRELELTHREPTSSQGPQALNDIAKQISIQAREFSTSYMARNPLDGAMETVKVHIRYPQIVGHPDKNIERKLNDFLMNWAGVNINHQIEYFDHVASFEVVSLEANTAVIFLEDGGIYLGAATGATINKTIVLNLINGERFELKDLFRANYKEQLYKLVRQRAFCDPEKTRLADDPGPIRDDQEFVLDHGDLILVYQRRAICAGADGPTLVTIESQALKSMLNPNGPLGYLL